MKKSGVLGKQLLYYNRHISKYYAIHIPIYIALFSFHKYEGFSTLQCLFITVMCMALILAMALVTTGCNDNTDNGMPSGEGTESNVQVESNQLGEGSTKFIFTVVDKEDNETRFEIHTDKENVGEALTELELIAGEESDYGLYVKTVNGITVDYDKDGLSFKAMIAWIIAGLPWDCIHGVSNFLCGILIMLIASALRLAERNIGKTVT